MKIGIIGAGNIGGTLTRRLTALGHNVLVANARGPESLANLAAETGAVPMPITEIAQDVDMVIVSTPLKTHDIRNEMMEVQKRTVEIPLTGDGRMQAVHLYDTQHG